jgi:hypothetical protein
MNIDNQIQNFRSEISHMVQRMFKEQGVIEPVLFALVFKENRFNIAVLGGLEKFFISPDGKEAAAIIMRKFNDETKPLAIAFASEGWMSSYAKDDSPVDEQGFFKEDVVKPSKDPKRKEVVNISFETYNKSAFNCWEISRKDNIATLVETTYNMEWGAKNENLTGVFMDLLRENHDHIANLLKEINLN